MARGFGRFLLAAMLCVVSRSAWARPDLPVHERLRALNVLVTDMLRPSRQPVDANAPSEFDVVFRVGENVAAGDLKEICDILAKLAVVDRVTFHHPKFTDEAAKALRGSLVRRLTFWETPVTPATIATLGTLSNLEELTITGSVVSDDTLAALPPLPLLHTLDLQDCNSGAGLARALPMPRLVSVGLHGAIVTDDGVEAVAAATGSDQWKRLTIQKTRLTRRGAASLSKFGAVENLSLRDSPGVDDSVWEILATLKSLRRLDVTGTSVTRVGVDAAALDDLKLPPQLTPDTAQAERRRELIRQYEAEIRRLERTGGGRTTGLRDELKALRRGTQSGK